MKINTWLSLVIAIVSLAGCNSGSNSSSSTTAGNTDYDNIPEDPESTIYIENFKNNGKPRIIIVSHNTVDADYLEYTKKIHLSYAKHIDADYWFRNGTIDNGYFYDKNGENRILKYGLYWQKIQAVLDALDKKDQNGNPKYDYVIWIDSDAYFTNFDTNFLTLIQETDDYLSTATDFIIAADKISCVNAGVFVVKNNDVGRAVMNNVKKAFHKYKDVKLPEQSALQDYLYGYMTVTGDTVTVDAPEDVHNRACKYVPEGRYTAELINDTSYVRTSPVVMNSWFKSSGYGYLGGHGLGIGDNDNFTWSEGDFIAHTPAANNKKELAIEIEQFVKSRGWLND